jgi:hypothetical protein
LYRNVLPPIHLLPGLAKDALARSRLAELTALPGAAVMPGRDNWPADPANPCQRRV